MLLRIAILLVTVSLAPVTRAAFAQTPTSGSVEYQVKAALIYNFAKFVDWPADATAGDTLISSQLLRLAEIVDGHHVGEN